MMLVVSLSLWLVCLKIQYIMYSFSGDAVPVFVWVLVGFAAVIIAVAVVVGYRQVNENTSTVKPH